MVKVVELSRLFRRTILRRVSRQSGMARAITATQRYRIVLHLPKGVLRGVVVPVSVKRRSKVYVHPRRLSRVEERTRLQLLRQEVIARLHLVVRDNVHVTIRSFRITRDLYRAR